MNGGRTPCKQSATPKANVIDRGQTGCARAVGHAAASVSLEHVPKGASGDIGSVRSKAVERQSAGNKSAENHQDNRAPAAQQPTESFEITTRSVLKKIQLAVNLFRILPQAIYAYSKLTVD